MNSDYLAMNAGTRLQQRPQTSYHGRFDIYVRQRFSRARRMAADDVVLQIGQIAVVDPPLCHGPEPGIDSVNPLFG